MTKLTGMRSFTPEMFEELQISSNDATYFMEKFLNIDVADMDDIQEASITQDPKLTLKQLCAYVVWASIFHPQHTSVVVLKSMFQRRKANSMVRTLFKELPDWMRPNFTEEFVGRLVLVNYSRIFFQIACPHIVQGMTVSLIVFAKYAELPVRLRDEMLIHIAPTLCHGTQIIVDHIEPAFKFT